MAEDDHASSLVEIVGNNTFFGRTASLVASAGSGASHSQKATTQIGDFLIITSVILCAILVGFELYQDIVVKDAWQWSELADIARMVLVLLIASIPVAMPTVMTVTNSLGAQALARKKAIVSRLEAIEELAGVDILCSDKTGTLSKDTIRRAKEHGLRVKMVTGDDVAIGDQISGQLGMGSHLIAAADMFTKDMDMDHLSARIEECVDKADGFGRVFPEHKYGIVRALQHRDHVVGMTGDGVNDAPALKQTACGIAVSGATDAARAAAALILTAPGLSTIIDAIDEARKIFERIINYILFRVAMTLDIMFVVVLATVFFGFSPLTPVMIILLALLDDIPIMTIAYDNTLLPKEPVRWQKRKLLLVSSFMGLMAVVQSFGLLLIGMEWLSNSDWQSWIKLTQDQVQTAVFLQIVAGGHLLLFVMRARGLFFSRPWPAMPLVAAIVGTQIFAVLMCGFGWFVTALPWTIIGLVWSYRADA